MSKSHEINKLLDEAYAHEQAASAKRRAAGRQLAALRAAYPDCWRQIARLDPITADQLLRMARAN